MDSRLLLIAYHFPPLNSVASLRTYAFARYLAGSGYRVTVLTAAHGVGPTSLHFDLNPELFTVRTAGKVPAQSAESAPPARFTRFARIKKALATHLIGNLVTSADSWFPAALAAAHRLMKKERYDVVVSTFSPVTAHVIAWTLRRKFPTICWVADYRDLWACNYGVPRPVAPLDRFQAWFEGVMNRSATLITTVSGPLRDDLARRSGRPTYVVENGYLPEDEIPAADQDAGFTRRYTFVYTGSIYRGKRDPSPFLSVLQELVAAGRLGRDEVEVRFYGENSHLLEQLVAETGSGDMVRLLPLVSRDESLRVQRQATAILFLESDDPGSRGNLTGKLFEHLVAGVPIIAVGISNGHAAGQVITSTRTGYVCGTDPDAIRSALLEVLAGVQIHPDRERIGEFRRDRQVQRLAGIIEEHRANP